MASIIAIPQWVMIFMVVFPYLILLAKNSAICSRSETLIMWKEGRRSLRNLLMSLLGRGDRLLLQPRTRSTTFLSPKGLGFCASCEQPKMKASSAWTWKWARFYLTWSWVIFLNEEIFTWRGWLGGEEKRENFKKYERMSNAQGKNC